MSCYQHIPVVRKRVVNVNEIYNVMCPLQQRLVHIAQKWERHRMVNTMSAKAGVHLAEVEDQRNDDCRRPDHRDHGLVEKKVIF